MCWWVVEAFASCPAFSTHPFHLFTTSSYVADQKMIRLNPTNKRWLTIRLFAKLPQPAAGVHHNIFSWVKKFDAISETRRHLVKAAMTRPIHYLHTVALIILLCKLSLLVVWHQLISPHFEILAWKQEQIKSGWQFFLFEWFQEWVRIPESKRDVWQLEHSGPLSFCLWGGILRY